MIFAAKVDLWFLALFYGFGLFMLIAAPLIRHRPRGSFAAGLLIFLGLLFLGVGWTASEVRYVLTESGHLESIGWPYAGRIAHLSEIERIEESSDLRSSQAASVDRLRIDYLRKGRRRGLVFIAVEDEAGFLEAIAARDSGFVRTPHGLIRATD